MINKGTHLLIKKRLWKFRHKDIQEKVKEQGSIRRSGLTYVQKSSSVIENPQGLSLFFLPFKYTQKFVSQTYSEKSVSVIDNPKSLSPIFLPHTHRNLYL